MSGEADDFKIPDSAEEFLERAGDDSAAPVHRAERATAGKYDLTCWHKRVSLDPDSHRVYCRDCETEVDPWEVLNHLAQNWERWANVRDTAKQEAKYRLGDVEQVKREERNTKSRLRRAKDGLYSVSEIVAQLNELDALIDRSIDRVADEGNRRFALGLKQRLVAILDDPRRADQPTTKEENDD